MNLKDKLAELNRHQAQALAEFYAATKTLERAEERVKSISQQIALVSDLVNADVKPE